MDDERSIKDELYARACDELGLKLEAVDERGDVRRVWYGDEFFLTSFYGWPPLNALNIRGLARDKVFTKLLLAEAGISVPKGGYVFVSGKGDWEPTEHLADEAESVAAEVGYPVFVKPNDASRGRGATLCTQPTQLSEALERVKEFSHMAVIEEVIDGREGRLFCIDGEVQFMYHKQPNPETSVANRAAGGTIENVTTEVSQHLQVLAEDVFKVFGGDLRIFAVDFVELESGEVVVFEVNAQPFLAGICALGHTDLAIEVLKTMLRKHFCIS